MDTNIIQLDLIIIVGISILTLILLIILKSFKPAGLIIYILSLLLYIAGSLLKNLFLVFLSTSFLIIFLLLTIYYFVILFIYRKKSIEFSLYNFNIIHPFKESEIDFTAINLPSPFPGVFSVLSYGVFENHDLIIKKNSSINYKNKNLISINEIFPRHGEFYLKNFRLIIFDVFGFTKFGINIKFECSITVYPYFIDYAQIPFFLESGGEEILQSVVKENSTDFFENRKYYPGDDIRRINWKIFAHSGELHVREVEKIPPKIGKITLLYAPYSKNILEYEHISALFLSTINYLLKYGFAIQIICPISNNPIMLEEKSEKEFNRIINNSYKPFMQDGLAFNQKPVVFASYEEFTRLLEKNLINNCFCVASCYIDSSVRNDLIKEIVFVGDNDSLIKDIIHKIKNFNDKKNRDRKLNDVSEIANKKRVQLKF